MEITLIKFVAAVTISPIVGYWITRYLARDIAMTRGAHRVEPFLEETVQSTRVFYAALGIVMVPAILLLGGGWQITAAFVICLAWMIYVVRPMADLVRDKI